MRPLPPVLTPRVRQPSPREYYRETAVRRQLIEYCGGNGLDPATCTAQYVVASSLATQGLGIPQEQDVFPPSEADMFLDRGEDLYRSLWDSASTIGIMDIDYQNLDFPSYGMDDPWHCFSSLEPVFQAARHTMKESGISYLALMTGQGYHLVFRVPDSPSDEGLTRELQGLSRVLPTLEAKYAYDHPFTAGTVPREKGLRHQSMGLLMEYLCHLTLQKVYLKTGFPAVVGGQRVGTSRKGRESASLDLSAYGDPLFMRYTRCSFSLYHKGVRPGTTVTCLPREDQTVRRMLSVRGDLALAGDHARGASAAIPDAGAGVSRLIRQYKASRLRRFHAYYESGRQDDPRDWPETYDRTDLSRFSPCVAWPLLCPNSILPQPSNMQNVARVLVSAGWHPRSVAGLIRSKFERDYAWGQNWLYYDAATRADFYVRVFCGLVATGMDDLRDLNCVSHQEKGCCPRPWCGFNLADYKEPLKQALSV